MVHLTTSETGIAVSWLRFHRNVLDDRVGSRGVVAELDKRREFAGRRAERVPRVTINRRSRFAFDTRAFIRAPAYVRVYTPARYIHATHDTRAFSFFTRLAPLFSRVNVCPLSRFLPTTLRRKPRPLFPFSREIPLGF